MEDVIIYNELTSEYLKSIDIYTESRILDEAIGKNKDESTLVKIIKFIPRLIRAIISTIRNYIFDKTTDFKLRQIKAELNKNTVTESFVFETPIIYALDNDIKSLHKHSGKFKQYTHKLYDDCTDILYNIRNLLSMKDESKRFSNEWNISKVYMNYMNEINVWAKHLVKYDTDRPTGSFSFYDREGRTNQYNKQRLANVFSFMEEIRTNMTGAMMYLTKTERLMNKNELDMMIGNLENKISDIVQTIFKDIYNGCKCLSVIATKLAELVKNTIDLMYKSIKEGLR